MLCIYKLLRPLIRYWRGSGIRAVIYIDHGIVVITGEREAHATSLRVQEDLRNAGFVTNIKKSKWVPSKTTTWLGFDINLGSNLLTVPLSKIEALQLQIQQAIMSKAGPSSIAGTVLAVPVFTSLNEETSKEKIYVYIYIYIYIYKIRYTFNHMQKWRTLRTLWVLQ